MIRYFKKLLAAIQAIAQSCAVLGDILSTGVREASGVQGFEDRLSSLERTLDVREAQAEATLERAESKFKAARASEERARHHANSVRRAQDGDEDGDDGEDLFAQYAEQLRSRNAEASEVDGVQFVRSGMGARREVRESLRQLKFGR